MKTDWNPLSDGDQIRLLKFICIALPAGMILFSVIAISVEGAGTSTYDASTFVMLRIAHLLITVAAISGQKFFYQRILSGKLSNRYAQLSIAARYCTAAIVKLAGFEGSALFGLVLILNASTGGMMNSDPTLYIHLLPVLLLIGAAWSSYPSEQKIAELSRLYPNQDNSLY
jgi:hypothetical protein